MNDNSKQAADYARKNALSAADNHYIERRPDPAINRSAYEAWYYSLTAAQQQAEWDMYYSETGTTQAIDTNQISQDNTSQTEHAVSTSYAHSHVTPEVKTVQPESTVPDTTVEAAVASDSSITEASPSQKVIDSVQEAVKEECRPKKKGLILKPLIVSVTTFALAMLVFFNQVVVAQVRQYVRPGTQLSTPVIVDPDDNVCEGKNDSVLIPKINVDANVVYDERSYEEEAIQAALERGVVHYGETTLPGEVGNNVIVGHSSGNFFNAGKFKYAFVLLDHLEIGDTFNLCYENERFIYKIVTSVVVEPTNLDYVQQYYPETNQPIDVPLTTLITCSPPGTSWKRLIIQGEQISPSPDTASQPVAQSAPVEPQLVTVPGNSPSLWGKLTGWL